MHSGRSRYGSSTSPQRPRDVHVHVCEAGSTWEREHLVFRDHLRAHADARERYAAVKRDTAARWSDDGFAYTDVKTAVVLAIMADADRGRSRRSW